jgi:organic hydroperoxide reductase OsmC/OhrA
MSEKLLHFSVELESREGYEFVARFDEPKDAELRLDEPPPLGAGRGPNAARLVAAAVANCLSASLLFCLRGKFKQHPGPLRAVATGTLVRNEKGRYRIGGIDVVLSLDAPQGALAHLDRCLEQFEDFCVVTESVRRGIPVSVKVLDEAGAELA